MDTQCITISTPSDSEVLVQWTKELTVGTFLSDDMLDVIAHLPGVDAVDMRRYTARVAVARHVTTAADVQQAIAEVLTPERHWLGDDLARLAGPVHVATVHG